MLGSPRVCVVLGMCVNGCILPVNVRLAALFPISFWRFTFCFFCCCFVLGFFYIFILGFLISPKALAYTSLRAWLHLSVEDVWPPGPAYALLVCWRFTKLTVFFLWKRFKIGSNPHNVTRAWFLFDFFKLCLFFDGVRFMFSLQKIF